MHVRRTANRRRVSQTAGDALERGGDFFFASPNSAAGSASAPMLSTVPIQVRKSLAEKSPPAISRRYSLTSSERTLLTDPASSIYVKSSSPGRSRQRLIMRASRASSSRISCSFPVLPRNLSRTREPSSRTCRVRRVVRPKDPLAAAYSSLPTRMPVTSNNETRAASTLRRESSVPSRSLATAFRIAGRARPNVTRRWYFASSRTSRKRL